MSELIFGASLVRTILAEGVATLRIPASHAQYANLCELMPGIYALLDAETDVTVGVVEITEITHQPLYKVTDADAQSEGFKNRRAFLKTYFATYPNLVMAEDTIVLSFEVVK